MLKKKSSILIIVLLAVVLFVSAAWGKDGYPTKPINFLIPFGAGGSADLMGRALANGAENFEKSLEGII